VITNSPGVVRLVYYSLMCCSNILSGVQYRIGTRCGLKFVHHLSKCGGKNENLRALKSVIRDCVTCAILPNHRFLDT
jgi:hypothetical protein